MTYISQNNKGLSKMIIVAVLGFIVVVIGVVVYQVIKPKPVIPKNITLTMWGVYDESTDVADMIASYHKAHPYITINYLKKRPEEFEDALIKGWATDTGPDIYALSNTWVNQYRTDFISPMPATTRIAFYATQKVLFTTETKITYAVKPSLTTADIKRNFIDTIYDDIVFDGKVYGLPFGINTLVMYYNKDLLNKAHMAEPPSTWNEFISAVNAITITNDNNEVVRAGAALGTYNNIPNASDIITLLMLQNGTAMTTGNKVTFNLPSASDGTYFPAEEALRFYTDFASPEKEVYTWNDKVTTNAFDLFAQGNVGFVLGYRFQESEITSRGMSSDAYGVAPIPQITPENEINYANYWVYTVAKKSKHTNEAWAFLQYGADAKRAQPYDQKTKQSSVLRTVIKDQINDPDLGVFAEQALTSHSWYHGKNPQKADQYFADMIKSVVDNAAEIKQAVTLTALKIQQEY
jgi:ABC-type glycerol-3-phosphate transport system substrate-binding protein